MLPAGVCPRWPVSVSPPHRILHVIDSLDLGGAQEALLHLLACADRARFSFEVASMHRDGVYGDRIRALGIPVHSLSPHKAVPLYLPRLFLLLRRRRFDAVHCHLLAANILAKPVAAAAGVRIRFSHDQANDAARHRNPVLRSLDRWTNRLSTHIFAVSESTRDFLVRIEGLPAARVSLVPNGVRVGTAPPDDDARAAARARWGSGPGAVAVGGIGRLHPQKGFDRFLEAAALAISANGNLRFLIAGSGPEEASLRARAERLGLDPVRVRFVGYLPGSEALLPALDLLLMPSRFEGLPLALLEAMAAGVPAVGARVDGIAEILEHGRDGWLVDPDDIPGYAAALGSLAIDPALRARLGTAARAKVEGRYSAEAMTRAVESEYRRQLEPGFR